MDIFEDITRRMAVFYTCGTCNLKCRYCNIDKNPILKKIDDKLAESFEGDYYFDAMKKWFPSPTQLEKIETWGGEPMLHMERIHPLLHKVINYYPSFKQFFCSTNFSYSEWNDKVFDLLKVFGEYPNRKFNITIQLSMDGPPYINDLNRGDGVSQKCMDNLDIFYKRAKKEIPSNTVVELVFKQTLDNTTIRLLCSKEKLIEYYQYFENFYEKFNELCMPNLIFEPSIPNTAAPSPTTKLDGQIFAELCKLCYEIEQENKINHYFKYFRKIMPYFGEPCQPLGYENQSITCGSGTTMVCFLPDNLISTCHEGFTALYEDYKNYAQTSSRVDDGTIDFSKWVADQGPVYVLDEKKYKDHEIFMKGFTKRNSTTRMSYLTAQIRSLALAGQVDEKYIYEYRAIQAAQFLLSHTAYCIKDNYNVTGSFTMGPPGFVKLLLNGAKEYIEASEKED